MKLFIHTFGCQMNAADSEEMLAHFKSQGFELCAEQEQADAVLLNTCTVRQHAEDKALSLLGRLRPWRKADSKRLLVVAGCAAERLQKDLKHRFPHIDLIVGAKRIEEFPALLQHHLLKKARFDFAVESEASLEASPLSLNPPEMGYVTIMRGCNYSCSYCIVPSVRGREIYRDPQKIIQEVLGHLERGAKSIMLLGQTVNSYWHLDENKKRTDFVDLLRQVHDLPGDFTIQFMSPHPHYLDERMIQALCTLPKIFPQIHMPVQSGSNRILSLMKRNYSREEYIEKMLKLAAAMPNLQLSTDFIVGFPTETERDFAETLSLFKALPFQQAFCFKYSPRAGTVSAAMPDDVANDVKERRLAELLQLLDERRDANRAQKSAHAISAA